MLGMGGGTKKTGRPRSLWLDDIKAITKYIGLNFTLRTTRFRNRSKCIEEEDRDNH